MPVVKHKGWANICFCAILSLLAVSCRLVDPITPEIPLNIRSFSVSGVVTDISGEPIGGIAVTLRAFDVDDKDRSEEKYYCIVSTGSDGSYSINKVWTENAARYYFVFQVSDPSDTYGPMEREMFLSAGSPFYSGDKKSYDVKGNDFTLSLKDNGAE